MVHCEVASFDVFETVLVRSVSPPQAVFQEVGRRARQAGLLQRMSALAFSEAREQAERRAARNRGDCFTLSDCYDELQHALGLPDDTREALCRLEMQTELALLRPVEPARALLEQARQEGLRVVFVSDMYLPGRVIEQALRRSGMWADGDRLYVSCEHGCGKRSGTLFERVAAAEGVPVAAIRHYGNNWHVDIEGARRAGAASAFLDDGNPTRYEQIMHRYRTTTDGASAALAGASRLARLSAPGTARRGLDMPALRG